MKIDRALVVKKVWLDKILDNGKIWEMRTTKTYVRGVVGLIEAGTGLIVGTTEIVGCAKPIETPENAWSTKKLHQVEYIELLKKWKCPWILKDSKRLDKPIPYDHPQGAVIWVRFDKEIEV